VRFRGGYERRVSSYREKPYNTEDGTPPKVGFRNGSSFDIFSILPEILNFLIFFETKAGFYCGMKKHML
jgi:hypothetical protein